MAALSSAIRSSASSRPSQGATAQQADLIAHIVEERGVVDSAIVNLGGVFSLLKQKKCYILGVSATPFSEIVANKKVQTSDWTSGESAFLDGVELSAKNFYFMHPGSGYIGVSELLESGSIKFEAENIKASDCAHVASVLRKNSPKYHQKYIFLEL